MAGAALCVCVPACLSAFLPACPSVRASVCVCLPACLPACLSASASASASAFVSVTVYACFCSSVACHLAVWSCLSGAYLYSLHQSVGSETGWGDLALTNGNAFLVNLHMR